MSARASAGSKSPATTRLAFDGPVEAIEERPHVVDGGRLQILVRADRRPVVGVVGRVHRLGDGQLGAAVGAVLVRLPPLVLHDLALLLELLVGDDVGERGQAIGLEPEERLQQIARPDLVVVRPVVAGGAVVVAAPALHDGVERRVGRVARAHEHQVLEQVREPGAAGRLVLRADVVPEIDGDERAAAVRCGGSPVSPLASTNVSNSILSIGAGTSAGIMSHESMRASPVKRAFPAGRLDGRGCWRADRGSGRALPRAARANGAFPESLRLLLPADGRRRSASPRTFGLIISDDGGASWTWTCEQPATSMATLYASARRRLDRFFSLSPLVGLAFSDDESCTWTRGGSLDGPRSRPTSSPTRPNPMRVCAMRRACHRRWRRCRRRSSRRTTVARRSAPTPIYTAPAGASLVGHRDRAQRSAGHLPRPRDVDRQRLPPDAGALDRRRRELDADRRRAAARARTTSASSPSTRRRAACSRCA